MRLSAADTRDFIAIFQWETRPVYYTGLLSVSSACRGQVVIQPAKRQLKFSQSVCHLLARTSPDFIRRLLCATVCEIALDTTQVLSWGLATTLPTLKYDLEGWLQHKLELTAKAVRMRVALRDQSGSFGTSAYKHIYPPCPAKVGDARIWSVSLFQYSPS